MYTNTEFLLAQAAETRRKLVAEAEQYRLLTAARRRRRAGRAGGSRGAGNLVGCAPPAAA
jgi:hypothetical protein